MDLRTLSTLLSSLAQEEGGRTAFRFIPDGDGDGTAVTYSELDRGARRFAACLQALGARPGERALILLPPGLDYIEALFGCAQAGVIALPVYPPRANRSLLRLRAVAGDAGARFAIADAAALGLVERRLADEPALAGLTWVTPEMAAGHDPAAARAAPVEPGAPAVLQYTSGSTGDPKGVILSHRNLLANAGTIAGLGQLTREDRFVGWLPPFHDMGLIGAIVTPVLAGFESILFPPAAFTQQPLRWLRALTRFRGTVTAGPNFAYGLCARRVTPDELSRLDLGALRLAVCGAERVSPATVEAFSTALAPAGFRREAFRPAYGLAEATLAVSIGVPGTRPLVAELDGAALISGRAEAARPGAQARSLVANGPPVGCEVAVVAPDTGTRRGTGEVGEIWVRGSSVAGGYWNRPELSQRTFQATLAGEPGGGPGWLRTGDLGFLREGEVFVTGRLKDVLVLLGVNHHPEDLEATVAGVHGRLRPDCGVAVAVEAEGEERLALVLEVDSPRDLPVEEIAAAVRGAVAEEHALPVHEVVLVGAGRIPRTSSGKVQRGLCRELLQAGRLEVLATSRQGAEQAAAGEGVPGELVGRVRSLMAEVLSLAEVAPDDDFFDLGGHSLLATQLISRVHQAFGTDLPLRAVFEAPTAAGLARLIAAAGDVRAPPPIVPVDRRGPLPLSFSQERMWFLHQLDPGSSAYNVAGAVSVEGPLDAQALARALQAVVDRHEILRTSYTAVDGAPRVGIAASLPLPLPVVDLTAGLSPEAAALERVEAIASAPFDLARDPLVRAGLFRVGPDRHVIALCLHHIVADGWSMGVLLSQVFQGYQAFRGGRPDAGPAPALQYLDYAAWQRRHVGDTVARGLEFWRQHLAGAPMLQLPTDRPRLRPSSRGAVQPVPLPRELLEQLNALAQRHGATLFMVTLAAFQVLLHRYSGQRTIVLGVPIANRNRLSAEPLVGTLVNTLPLRVEVDPETTFAGLLESVREIALDAYAHQEVPLEQLVAELRVARAAGDSPLFPVMFDFLNVPMPVTGAGEIRLRPLTFSRQAAQFDLSLSILDTELGQVGSFEYRTDLYEASTIRRLAGHYRAVLEAVAADPAVRLSAIPLLSAEERAAQLARAAASCSGPLATEPVPRQVAARAAATPGAPAVADAAGTLSYRELDRASDALAARLAALGAGPGQRVAIGLSRSRAVPVALLATLKTGAAYVPLDPRYPADRIRYVLDDAEPPILVTDRTAEELAVPPGVSLLRLDPGRLELADVPFEGPRVDPSSIAYVIYTSGSTGRPKGIEIPHGALSNFIASMSHTPGLAAADRLLSVTTISFDIAGLEVFLPLCVGACVEIAATEVVEDGRRLAERLERSGATFMQATPATWRMLIESGWRGDGRLKALVGGEALSRELADLLLARAGEVWNMYGPTETTIWSTLQRVAAGEGPVAIGGPVDHTRLYVLDARGGLVPDGLPGEIVIGGAGVARGYFRRPELTAERFLPDPHAGPGARMYRTGDLGRFRHDGALEYLGRLDHQIKIRGHRVEPGEIEAVLREQPQVRDAVVIAREDRPGDVRLVGYLVARGEPAPAPQELRDRLRQRLPAYMVPSALVTLPALPLTPNGKIDRKALPAPAPEPAGAEAAAVAPRDALEAEILEVWSEVLGTPVAGVTESFFDLGGHSLLVARLLDRIEKRTGVALPFAALLDRPTVEHLAEEVRRQRGAGGAAEALPALVELQQHGDLAPIFCVHGAGGNVLNLRDVGRHMNPDRPFVGVQARSTDGTTRPPSTIEEMAGGYLAEIRQRQPAGPYHLSGYCGGGIVAFEMAHQLRAAGEQVATVTLIDCPCPTLPAGPGWVRRWSNIVWRERLAEIGRRARARLAEWRQRLTCQLRIGLSLWRGAPVPYELRDYWLILEFQRALGHYQLRRAPFKLVVLRARDSVPLVPDVDDALGWVPYADEVEAHEVPGDHHTITLEPNVQELVARLEASASAVEGGRLPIAARA